MALPDVSKAHVTFATCDVPLATRVCPEVTYEMAIQILLNEGFRSSVGILSRKLEAHSGRVPNLVPISGNGLINIIHIAFAEHRPLVLAPDHIWLLICQGFAEHVNANAETLRRYFVQHDGQKELKIQRDGWGKSDPNNDWESVAAEFSQLIRQNLGVHHDLLSASFSTTTLIEQTAFEVTLMDAFQSYFEYTVVSWCGIPSITLEGTTGDWEQVLERTQSLRAFECGKWVTALTPILEQFVRASRNDIDVEFWRSIYKEHSISGGPYITGWILNFFPYFAKRKPNPYLNESLGQLPIDPKNSRVTPAILPIGLSGAPVKWVNFLETFDMYFVAGFIGATQDYRSKAVRPEIGWAISEVRVP